MAVYNQDEFENLLEKIVQIIQNYDGKPCPTDIAFSKMLRTNERRVSYALRRLVATGRLIRVNDSKQRNFQCAETGKRTRSHNPKILQKQRRHISSANEIPGAWPMKWNEPPPPYPWYGRIEWFDDRGRRLNDYGQYIGK